jgi:signal transduction histidine kinase
VRTAGRRIPIKVKLVAVLAVPVLGYVVVTTTAVLQAQQTANELHDQARIVATAVGPTSLTTSLIDERTITALERAGLQEDLTLSVQDSTQARRATDEQLSALQTLLDGNKEAREAYKSAVDEVADGIETLRSDADAQQEDIDNIFARYSEYISTLTDANQGAVEMLDDAELWQGAKLAELATRQKDARALLINALIPVGFNEDEMTEEQSIAIGRVLGSYETRDAALSALATGPYARAGSVLVEALETNDLAALARGVLGTGQLNLPDLYTAASYQAGFVYEGRPTGDTIHDNFRGLVVDVLDDEASQRSAAAARSLRIHLASGSLGLLLTAVIAWAVSRSITRPLRSLTDQAIGTATDRLPSNVQQILATPLGENVMWPQMEPVYVESRDEVADVADALNTMQDSALRLAVEEAILRRHITDSLVTLGQRNQNLLSRQIAFITELERDETNSDVLANLFYLDHLATRMRRNAESLLVLAGIDPPRKWVGPTPVNDVIRAALGEAEEYKRVRVEEVAPATIVGSAAAELSHLLAELIENALTFSPPNKQVEVKGRRRAVYDSMDTLGGYTVTVRDFGVGMSVDELNQANRRLAVEESYTIAPSKYMGHYVAGKLAARHGITVQLHNARGGHGGTTATVDIPATLLTTEAPSSDATEHMPPLPPLPTAAEAGRAAAPGPGPMGPGPIGPRPIGPVPGPTGPTVPPGPTPGPGPIRPGGPLEPDLPTPGPLEPDPPAPGPYDPDADETAPSPPIPPIPETPATLATLATGPPSDPSEQDTEEQIEVSTAAEIYILPPPPLDPLTDPEPDAGPPEGGLPDLPPPVPLPNANAAGSAAPPSGRSRSGSGRSGSGQGSGRSRQRPGRSGSGQGSRRSGQGSGQRSGRSGQGANRAAQAQAPGRSRQASGAPGRAEQQTSGRAAGKGSGKAAQASNRSGAGATQRKPAAKKRKKRSPPIAANKLPVPPPSQPLEASSDSE